MPKILCSWSSMLLNSVMSAAKKLKIKCRVNSSSKEHFAVALAEAFVETAHPRPWKCWQKQCWNNETGVSLRTGETGEYWKVTGGLLWEGRSSLRKQATFSPRIPWSSQRIIWSLMPNQHPDESISFFF